MTIRELEIIIGIMIFLRIGINLVKYAWSWKKPAKEYIDSIIISGLVALFLISYIVGTFYVPSGSMKPTFVPIDYIIVNKLLYRITEPKRGDIVVFSPPHKKNSPDYIKRVIGLPNETLEVRDGQVLIDGKELEEAYIPEEQKPAYDYGPVKIPGGCFFMMGDNRNNSEDSHVWGFLPRKNIEGKASLIFWPIWRAKLL